MSNNNYLQSLISAGADLMSNLYSIKFEVKNGEPEEKAALTIRNKDFTGPSFTMGTHSISFGTESLDIPSPSMEGSKSISFKFRLDENLAVYKLLKKQQSYTSIAKNSFTSTVVPGEDEYGDSNSSSFTITVYALDGASNSTRDTSVVDSTMLQLSDSSKQLYKLNYCWVKKLSGLSFSYDNTGPVELTADIGYYELSADPMTELTNTSSGTISTETGQPNPEGTGEPPVV